MTLPSARSWATRRVRCTVFQTSAAFDSRLRQAVRFETTGDQADLIVSPLDKLEEPPSLIQLWEAVAARLPRVDLPELLLEIAARTGFTEAFTHLTERTARVEDLAISVRAVLLAEACNTGVGPLVRQDIGV